MKIGRIKSVANAVLGMCSARERKILVLLLVMMIASAGLEVIGIGLIVPFISLLASPDLIKENDLIAGIYNILGIENINMFVLSLGGILFLLYIIKGLSVFVQTYVQSRFLFNKHARLARDLYGAYLAKPYSFHFQRESSDLLRNVTVEAGNITKGVMLPILAFLTDAITTIFICAFLFYMDPLVAVIIVASSAVVFYVIINAMGRKISKYGRDRKNGAAEMTKWVRQGLEGIKEVKILAKEKFFVDTFYNVSRSYVHSGKMYSVLSVIPRLILENLIVGVMLLIVAVVVLRGGQVNEAVGVLMLFAVSSIRIMPSINRMISSANGLRFYLPAIDAIHADMGLIDGDVNALSLEGEKLDLKKDIAFDDVYYKYPGASDWAIKGISIAIQKGKAVAIVGRSGSGKSTLMNLILCFHKVQQGELKIDGASVDNDIRAWQQSIGYVPQTIFILNGTIRENIAFGVDPEDVDDDRIKQVIMQVGLDDFVNLQPDGILTQVGENGVLLSGGQRQRVGIARALYREPAVLVLDEVTASLDSETERKVANLIDLLKGECTIIIIAHRFAAIQHCDEIIAMSEGIVVEKGSFEELLQARGYFHQLYQAQKLDIKNG